MKKVIQMAAISISFLLLNGCATTGDDISSMVSNVSVEKTTANTYSPTNPSSIKLYVDQKPTCKYVELGSVKVNTNDLVGLPISADETNNYFQNAAAKLGGNAVINIHPIMGYQAGIIIRCIN